MGWVRWSCAALALFVWSACKEKSPEPKATEAPVAAAKAEVAEPSGGARAALEADGVIPEPEEDPCISCTVDIARRVQGGFQTVDKCGSSGQPVVYPLSNLRVRVIEGGQAGSEFGLIEVPSSFGVDDPLDGLVPPEAKPDGWTEVRILADDSSGNTCASALKILQ